MTHPGARFFAPFSPRGSRLLVVGCHTGEEAAYLHETLRAEVDAIDIVLSNSARRRERDGLHFRQADVLDLPFPPASFDAVFYHHVIEHVSDAVLSLAEIARVLRPGGVMFIATPNRKRLLTPIDCEYGTLGLRARVNARMWRLRLTGRFDNQHAHAGFSRDELAGLLAADFEVEWLTRDYLLFKHGQLGWIGAVPGVAPSLYAICRRL